MANPPKPRTPAPTDRRGRAPPLDSFADLPTQDRPIGSADAMALPTVNLNVGLEDGGAPNPQTTVSGGDPSLGIHAPMAGVGTVLLPPPESSRELGPPDSGLREFIEGRLGASFGWSSPASPAPAGGARTIGRYAVLGGLGTGGMGEVLKVHDDHLDRTVALKVAKGELAPRELAKFVQEARITGRLEHPGIVPVHELGVDQGERLYMTMKCIEGETLEAVLRRLALRERIVAAAAAESGVRSRGWRAGFTRRYAPAPPTGAPGDEEWLPSLAERLGIFAKVCEAVGFAHARGVIHRDLKPANVMVGRHGEVLVVDWGLAKRLGAAEGTSRHTREPAPDASALATLDGSILGTPSYMPPEQAEGKIDQVDARSDVFALGAILYHVLTLERPYPGKSAHEVLQLAAACRPVAPRMRAPTLDIPWELDTVVMKAMARRREDRYPSADALRADLDAFLAGRILAGARYTAGQRFAKWVARHRMRLGVAGLAAALAVGFGAWALERARVASDRDRHAELARAARAEARWEDALLHAERAMALGAADDLGRVADESREALRQNERARNLDLARARAEAEALTQTAPIARQVEETAPYFHLARADVSSRLVRLRADLERLATRVSTGPLAELPLPWSRLGAGWYLVGEGRRAEAALARALELQPAGGVETGVDGERAWTHLRLGQLQLRDAIVCDLTRADQEGPERAEAPLARAKASFEAGTRAGGAPEVDVAVARAFAAVVAGAHDEALALCADGVVRFERELSASDFWLARALVAWHKGDAVDALASCDRCLAWKPHDAWAMVLRGAMRLRIDVARAAQGEVDPGDLDRARADLEAALAIHPQLAPAHLFLGLVERRADQLPAAIARYDQAIALDPGMAIARFNRGNARLAGRDPTGAIEDYGATLVAIPGYWPALLNRGRAYFEKKDPRAAAQDVDRAAAAAPHAWEPRASQASILLVLGQPRLARAALEAAIERAPAHARPRLQADLDRLPGANR